MVFSSITFIGFFLPAVMLFYWLSDSVRYKNAVLLVASLVFYAWGEPKWIFVMLASVAVNYVCTLLMGRTENVAARRALMLAGIGTALGFLVYFKYFAFLANAVLAIFKAEPVKGRTLPIGISFYTFQLLTYTIDVYRKKSPPQRSFFKLLLYISLFPQLIAGPIVNYKDVEEALSERRSSVDDIFDGLCRFACGLGKKVLLANTCGELLSHLELGAGASVLGAWTGAVAFSLQIYFDFSGYSDMAIGMGRMFGFRFRENFSHPYISGSVSEFWRRWHISLGAFFREYVYIPLGGSRVGKLRLVLNLLVVWTLTGFWHGAEWSFMLWGFYYGVLLCLEKLILGKKELPKPIGIPITLIIVVVGWVIFYHEGDLPGALSHIGAMFGGADSLTDPVTMYYLKSNAGILALSVVCCLPWSDWADKLRLSERGWCRVIEPIAVSALFAASIVMLVGQTYNPFLYFRF